jgi:hypothetical protein
VVISRDEILVDVLDPAGSEGEERREPVTLCLPHRLIPKAGGTTLVAGGSLTPLTRGTDPGLITAIRRAYAWKEELLSGKTPSVHAIARKHKFSRAYVRRIIRLAFLAPDITQAILDGNQPLTLTVDRLRDPIPLEWADQRRALGFVSNTIG